MTLIERIIDFPSMPLLKFVIVIAAMIMAAGLCCHLFTMIKVLVRGYPPEPEQDDTVF